MENKLNAEQIKKALECCIKAETFGDCEKLGCPAHTIQGCYFYLRTDEDYEGIIHIEMCKDALSLIKELTEENERLRDERDRYKRYYFNHDYDRMETDIRAEAYREMQERFSSLLEKEYKENTPEGADFYFKNGSHMMWSVADRVFDQIAKEMLEGVK